MGLFSSFKKAVKRVSQLAKFAGRLGARIIITFFASAGDLYDLALGFLKWPPKKMRIHIVILSEAVGKPLLDPKDPADAAALEAMITYAKTVYDAQLGVTLLPYGKTFAEVLDEPAPAHALTVHCVKDLGAFTDEAGDAGEYFAQHLAGWNVIPLSLAFPVTVFVVKEITDRGGCSLGPLTDYVVLSVDAVRNPSTMAHELGHACNLLRHSKSRSNLMWAQHDRGNVLDRLQKNLFRNSRHVTYF